MKRHMAVCGALCLLLAGWQVVAAQEKALETTVAAGLTLTDGNAKSLMTNASIITEGEKDRLGSVRAGIEGNYGRSTVDNQTQTTVKNAQAFANAKKTLDEHSFWYVDGSLLYDDIALIDYRAILGPGAGYYFIKNPATKLSAEVGPSYTWERVDGVRDDYLALRIAERFEHKLSKNAKVWESVEYIPQVSRFSNYFVNSELGAEAALNSKLNLRLVVQNRYDSEPGGGLKKNDVTVIAAVSMQLK